MEKSLISSGSTESQSLNIHPVLLNFRPIQRRMDYWRATRLFTILQFMVRKLDKFKQKK